MAYQFAGFFATAVIPKPDALPSGAVWREVESPFVGVGVRLPAFLGETPAQAELETLARQLGVDLVDRWLYLTYTCWGGRIDFVYGFGCFGGVPFGPVEEDALHEVETAYIRLMAQFGVSAEDAIHFKPFERGYWGED